MVERKKRETVCGEEGGWLTHSTRTSIRRPPPGFPGEKKEILIRDFSIREGDGSAINLAFLRGQRGESPPGPTREGGEKEEETV